MLVDVQQAYSSPVPSCFNDDDAISSPLYPLRYPNVVLFTLMIHYICHYMSLLYAVHVRDGGHKQLQDKHEARRPENTVEGGKGRARAR